jgi:hypothetical protein
MTANTPANRPAKREPMTAQQAREILAKLAVMTTDVLDLDDRLERLTIRHRDHAAEAT